MALQSAIGRQIVEQAGDRFAPAVRPDPFGQMNVWQQFDQGCVMVSAGFFYQNRMINRSKHGQIIQTVAERNCKHVAVRLLEQMRQYAYGCSFIVVAMQVVKPPSL